ncbi:MAG: YihY/virulence factor BrkB family protein [Phycisphaerales bacterium]
MPSPGASSATEPSARADASRPTAHGVVRVWRIACLMARRADADSVAATASALAYKTLLGLIPILVVVTLVAKTLMGAKFGPFVAGFIDSLGLDKMQIVPPSDGSAASKPVALGEWVETLVNQAASIDLSGLGWVGVAVTVTSAIWLMTSIELSFNRIFRARQGRTWLRRVVLYWFVLTASPLAIAGIPLLSSLLHDAGEQPALAWFVSVARNVSGLAILWLVLFFIYTIVPAARVRLHCAAVGSFAAAVAILALKGVLVAYFAHAFGMSKLYGSLGLVPVFMFWMYVVWLVVLLGLEVTAIVQTLQIRGLAAGEAADDGAFADPSALVAVMEEAARQWHAGTPVTRDSVAIALCIDDRLSGDMLEELVKAGFLAHTDADAYAPSRPPETIRADEVLAAAFRGCAGEESVQNAPVAAAIRRAQLETAARMALGTPRPDAPGR